jgi:hypothetical protein
MAFRKRNIALSRAPAGPDAPEGPSGPTISSPTPSIPGVRPSPIDGRPTTSTGTPSLDSILAGHAGLPLGTSILIEESGTTDYAGALLRFYAAEGVVQGHKVHVVGMGEMWGRELPGITEDRSDSRREGKERAEKMKIAWRYEGLGQFESSRGAFCVYTVNKSNVLDGFVLMMCIQVRTERLCKVMARQRSWCFATHLILLKGLRSMSGRRSTIFLLRTRVAYHRYSHRYYETCINNSPLRHQILSTAS